MLAGDAYEHAIDWWSLGVLFYALCTGVFPAFGVHDHLSMSQLLQVVSVEAPESLSHNCRYLINSVRLLLVSCTAPFSTHD